MPPLFSSRSLKGGCAKLAALALTGFAALIILCVIKPPLEWQGAHEVRFDDDTKDQVSKGASRIFYFYNNLGIDWSSWTTFTAPPAEMEKFL